MSNTINLEEELGLNTVSPELKAELLLNAERSIYKRVLINVLQSLSDEEKEALVKILDSQEEANNSFSNDEVMEYLRVHISDFDEMVTSEINLFKEEGMKFYKKMTNNEANV